jgi:shikimate kinase
MGVGAVPRNVILIGFSGTGKTRVGREVARLLGWELVDTDEEIERRAGRPVRHIFAEEGEPAFRDRERAQIRAACQGERRVVSTGGGAPVDPENRAAMLSGGTVVCLDAEPAAIYRRLMEDAGNSVAGRPMLSGSDPLDRIAALKEERWPSYAAAHHTVATDGLTVEEVAREVVKLVGIPPSRTGVSRRRGIP